MKAHYDFSKGIPNPYAESIRKNGYSVTVYTDSEHEDEDHIVKQYYVSPEEVAERAAKRDAHEKQLRRFTREKIKPTIT